MASLQEIRARLAEQDNKSSGKGNYSQSDNAIYPHWNIKEGETAALRFLPDKNPNNPFFWIERAMIKLPFNGIKGDPKAGQVTVQVPCMEMYGEACPVLAEVRPWYKDESLKELAGTYWKKRSFLFQGFVRTNPLEDDKTPENPIRRFIVSTSIIPLIRAGLMDPEVEELPTDYKRGLDFNMRKSKSSSGYADYSTSNWARKESALTEAEQAAIETFGLFDLTEFLPKKPTEADLKVIKEMFEASVDGRPYDPEKWGAYYRPYGVEAPNSPTSTKQAATTETGAPEVVTQAVDQDEVPGEVDEPIVVPTTPASPTGDKAADILAMIRARQSQT